MNILVCLSTINYSPTTFCSLDARPNVGMGWNVTLLNETNDRHRPHQLLAYSIFAIVCGRVFV